MSDLVRFEWRRTRSLRSTWWLLILMAAFALVTDLAVGLGDPGERLTAEGVVFNVVQRDLVIRWLIAAAIGAQAFGHDFRYGTIRPTLLAFPRRGRLLAGRAVAAALVAGVAALTVSAVSFVLLLLLTTPEATMFADVRMWRSLGLGVVSVSLVAALAVGLSAMLRSAGVPVVMMTLWAAIVEPAAMLGLGGGAASMLPFMSLVQLTMYRADSADLGSPTSLTPAVFPLFLALTLIAAARVVARRDATTH
jgi:ABC-2 type transport system permease protein